MEHLMTSEEVADILHVDPVTIRRLVNKGDLAAYRIGADYRFAPSDLENYLQRQRIPSHAEDNSGANPDTPLDQLTHLVRRVLQGKFITPSEVRDRFDRFTKRARNVLTLAQEEAIRFQHNYIGTEHLLLGLIREEQGVASQVLNNLGIDLQKVRDAVESIIGRGSHSMKDEAVGLTPRAKKVIELAVDEARRLGHRFVGTEHLLLGLIREGEGIAAHVIQDFGVGLEQVRAETIHVLQQNENHSSTLIPPVPEEAASLLPEGEQGLRCSRCNAGNLPYVHYCFNCGQQLVGNDPEQPE